VLYPLSYWSPARPLAIVYQTNRAQSEMDQVGFEPTSSRSLGEVTLPYTTSNLVVATPPRIEAIFRRSVVRPPAPARIARNTPRDSRRPTSTGRNTRERVAGRQPHIVDKRSNSPPHHPGICSTVTLRRKPKGLPCGSSRRLRAPPLDQPRGRVAQGCGDSSPHLGESSVPAQRHLGSSARRE